MKKKEIEKLILRQFADQYRDFPKGSIHSFECPDFIVNQKIKKIGIEITDLYRDHTDDGLSMQAQDSIQKIIVEKAQKIFEGKHGHVYSAYIAFNEKSKILKNEIEKYSEFIVSKFEWALNIKDTTFRDGIVMSGSYLETYRDQLFMIQLYKFSGEPFLNWEHSNVHEGEIINVESIKNAIRKKEHLVKKYRKCDETWLVLAVQFWNPLMDATIPEKFEFQVAQSGFQRIILYKTTQNIINEIYKNAA